MNYTKETARAKLEMLISKSKLTKKDANFLADQINLGMLEEIQPFLRNEEENTLSKEAKERLKISRNTLFSKFRML